ncbi:dnaJ subfamily B member 11 [Biomphalaria pfeifferi]|uniref:DnaJ subfamily B member 11 n=1 Tax=Biomphalaria pfeifferi TaxID=112525 RepID=A0AAD8FGN0_BIOPF|nr:dnaJ subfamily B member 11 [Biomphalaria pfeifferi]
MDLTFYIALLILLLALWYCRKLRRSPSLGNAKTIPGPKGFGCLKSFIASSRNNNSHELATELAQQYGDLVQVNILSQKIVYINDSRLARMIFNHPSLKEMTNDRPDTFLSKYVIYGNKNMAFTSRTDQQKVRRKLYHGVVKFYGENVRKFERIFMTSINKLTKEMQSLNEVNFSHEISMATLRVVDALLAGEESNCTKEHLEALENFDTTLSELFYFDMEAVLKPLPFLRFVPGLPFKTKYDALIKARDDLVNAYFHRLKETYIKGQERGVIDHLLTAQSKLEEEGDVESLCDDSVKALLCETTIASFLTTAHTVNTLVLLLILHPELQEKLHSEVKSVIGNETPSLRHRSSMPYTESSIIEALRYATAGPFLLPHSCREDVEMNGYLIEKGTILLANAWYCHRRSDQWEEPWTFKPDRFLDDNGQLLQADHPKRLNLIIFGSGSRSCPGEAFARSRMFLIVVTLIQNFEFFALDNVKLPDVDPRNWESKAVRAPGQFKCGIRPRTEIHLP